MEGNSNPSHTNISVFRSTILISRTHNLFITRIEYTCLERGAGQKRGCTYK